jgi:hypothetical protein
MGRIVHAFFQERERHFQVARFAVVDGADEPVLAAAPRDGGEFSNSAVDTPLRGLFLITKSIRDKTEFRPLGGKDKLARSILRRKRIAERRAFIVGPKSKAHLFSGLLLQVNIEFSIVVRNGLALAEIGGPLAFVGRGRDK